MIELQNISKSYKNNLISVLNNISLTVKDNEQIAITGPSGSGKSTLLRIIAGIEPPNNGLVKISNQIIYDLSDNKRAEIRSNHFGFIFQSFRLFSTLNAIENVALSLDIKGEKNTTETAKFWLSEVGLAERFNHYPVELSGGEMQRVAIARALASNPQFIIADEPTGNLDQKNSDMVKDLLTKCLSKSNASLILVTHDMNLASMCKTIYKITNGNLTK